MNNTLYRCGKYTGSLADPAYGALAAHTDERFIAASIFRLE
jgi:hypothetical protein